jgi:GAF domain-containing protein
LSIHEDQGITVWAYREKLAIRVDNVRTDPRWLDLYVAANTSTVAELDVPLLDGETVIGIINVESAQEGAFSQADQDFLVTLAGQAVLAVKNAQAHEQQLRLADELQTLIEIGAEITNQLDVQHMFDLILTQALRITQSDAGNFMLYDAEQGDLVMVAERGVVSEDKGQRQRLDEGIVGYVATHRQPLNVNVCKPPWDAVYRRFIPNICSELAVPVIEAGHLRGVINIESERTDHFDSGHERLLRALADLAVVAIQTIERYNKAERERQRFERLYQTARRLGTIADLDQIGRAYEIILQVAATYTESQVIIRRYNSATETLDVVQSLANHPIQPVLSLALGEGANGWVAVARKTLVIADVDNLPSGISVLRHTPDERSLVVTPIQFEDQYYGNLTLIHQQPNHFQDADVELFEGLAQQLALTLHRLEIAHAAQETQQRILASEIMSSIGQAAYELAHRLNNDLGLVRRSLNRIQEELRAGGFANPIVAGELGNIRNDVSGSLALAQSLRNDLANLRDDAIDRTTRPVIRVRELFEATIREYRALPQYIVVENHIPDTILVYGVHRQIDSILYNIVANAVDAMSEGGTISFYAREVGATVEIDFVDTGIGIAKAHLSKVFDLLFSTKGSSGFGLWSARLNALANRGNLRVKSEPGHGTVFTLVLPRAGDFGKRGS